MSPKTRKRRVATTAVIVVFLAAIWLIWPRDPQLLSRATRITSTTEWAPVLPYHWLGDNEILYAAGDKTAFVKGVRTYSFRRFRTSSGQTVPDEGFSEQYRSRPTSFAYADVSVSPNGQWLASPSFVTTADGTRVLDTHYVNYNLRNSSPYRANYILVDYSPPIWFPDSVHYLTVGFDYSEHNFGEITNTRVVIHSVRGIQEDRSIDGIPLAIKNWYKQLCRPDSPLPPDAAGTTPNWAVITRDGNFTALATRGTMGHSSVRIVQWKIEPGASTGRQKETIWTIHAPENMQIGQQALSPDGDRIAYVVDGAPNPPFPEWLYRLIPSLKKPGHIVALYVSRLDGSDMREVGRVPSGTITHLQWVPGGHNLSFVYGETLYVVEP